MQRRDIVAMAALTEAEALELRLPAGQPGSLVPAIATPKFGRETHLGYAVQWFGLGLVLVIGWIVVYRRGATRSDT